MALTMVVLPTPGPPVITVTLDISARRTAATWLAARLDRPVLEQHCAVEYRRASQAGAGGAPFQFGLTRDKLMKIRPFAWGYEKIDPLNEKVTCDGRESI